MDQDIKELMEKRNKANKNARATGSAADWQNYRDYRNNVKRALFEAERKYVEREREINNSQSISATWKVIRSCIPATEKSRPIYSKDLKELANDFNKFFSTVCVRAVSESKNVTLQN